MTLAKFHDRFDSLGMGDDGNVVYPETFRDDLTADYDEDFAAADAAIATRDAEIARLTGELVASKAHNYDLLKQIPAPESPDNPPAPNEDNSDDAPKGVSKLFKDAD